MEEPCGAQRVTTPPPGRALNLHGGATLALTDFISADRKSPARFPGRASPCRRRAYAASAAPCWRRPTRRTMPSIATPANISAQVPGSGAADTGGGTALISVT